MCHMLPFNVMLYNRGSVNSYLKQKIPRNPPYWIPLMICHPQSQCWWTSSPDSEDNCESKLYEYLWLFRYDTRGKVTSLPKCPGFRGFLVDKNTIFTLHNNSCFIPFPTNQLESQHWVSDRAKWLQNHYNDVIMGAMASQITNLTTVHSTVYSGTDQWKHQSSASLAFVREIHQWPVNSLHKWPVT